MTKPIGRKYIFLEKAISILALYFPFIEISSSYGAKVFLLSNNIILKNFFNSFLLNAVMFYIQHNIFIFSGMIGLFLICAQGRVPLSYFVRINIIQGILMSILCSCSICIYTFFPLWFKESLLGMICCNSIYFGTVGLILYMAILIYYSIVPRLPFLSQASEMQLQRR